ncbi:uncharacterized protein LOC134788542 [Penaeus indicus]|uniref:uncharacterized protein LOC134788542 n=1 Tax=Penaeus indicus TaxID=29960 RepID=UPI00300D8B34
MTALHMAAMQGLKSTAKLLIKYGLDPNARDENGHTPDNCADVWGMNDIRWWFLNSRTQIRYHYPGRNCMETAKRYMNMTTGI